MSGVDGKVMHPFAIVPFPDSRDDLWEHLHERLDLRPRDETSEN
jgi:hypothetical protein